MEIDDTYKTITKPGKEALFKDKNSKFYGYAFPISNEEEAKQHIEALKKQHHSARHWCYAWRIGESDPIYRANDDGEPSNSAGQPIYGQLLSKEVTNILVVVVRYFGGVKLGVGGLINAYKTAAQWALESSKIVKKTIDVTFLLSFEYKDMNNVMRIIKEHQLDIKDQDLHLTCKILLSVRKSEAHKIKDFFSSLYEVKVAIID
ncbi:IMPACT family protein [Aquimarina brevivitae]|uniref:Putative YigZ family protein n=1 Tax=Aquimarina brevivitae TaxID=323412 RepID=A0A4Q7NYW6_9FLAO|nr:YigZ family protein [Aquimarina brevivitae]RZS92623.1 putative YigZ family protein [Aquimarina brevivitae]